MVMFRTCAIVFQKSPGILVYTGARHICLKEPSLFRLQPSAPAFHNTFEKLFFGPEAFLSETLNDQSETVLFFLAIREYIY